MILQIEAVTVTRCSKTVVNIHNLTNLSTTINYFFKILYMMCFLDHNLFRRSTSVSWMMLFYILKKTNINKRTQSRSRSKIKADPLHWSRTLGHAVGASPPNGIGWPLKFCWIMPRTLRTKRGELNSQHCLLSSSINAFLELSGVCSQTSSF